MSGASPERVLRRGRAAAAAAVAAPRRALSWPDGPLPLARAAWTSHASQPATDRWIVEGAGGVLVPLNERELMIDLMTVLGLPVVIAARSGLGTINHTLLTIEALRARARADRRCRHGRTVRIPTTASPSRRAAT